MLTIPKSSVGRVLLALLVLASAAVPWAFDFSNPPTVIALVGHERGEALFAAVNSAYASETDETTTSYQAEVAVSNMLGDYSLELNDAVITLSRLDASAGPAWSQLPVAAYGLVVTAPVTAPALVLDRAVLAAMWSGVISAWDDPAIAALNGGDSPLEGNITLIVTAYDVAADEYASPTGVFGRALASFDPMGFGAAYAAHGGRLASMLLATVGPERVLIVAADSEAARLYALSGNATTYALSENAEAADVSWARLVNRAGATLGGPTAASLTAALDAFDPVTPEASLDVDIADGSSAGAWPLAGLVFAVVRARSNRSDCALHGEALTLLSWLQLNDNAIATIEAAGLVPLTLGFRRRTIDAMCDVTCNGVPAIPAVIILGSGTPLPLWASLARAYDPQGGTFRLKYFQRNQNIAMPMVSDYKIDFGTVGMITIPAAYTTRHPDLVLVPMFLMGHVVAYNVPELLRAPASLVLSLDVLAAIYLNEITHWNDPAIATLNPDLATLLPARPIHVVLNKGGPVNEAGGPLGGNPNRGLAQMLSAVPGFKEAVYSANDTAITYPVEATNRTFLGGRADVPTYLANTSYTIGEYGYSSMSFYRAIRYATLVNVDGGLVQPSEAALASAANTIDHLPANAFTVNSPGRDSWPVGLWNLFMIHTETLPNCRKTTALLDWFYWVQTSPEAIKIVGSLNCLVSSRVDWLAPRVLASIARVTCPATGLSAFSLHACVTFDAGSDDHATMCSGRGSCVKPASTGAAATCVCEPGWEGPRCEVPVEPGSELDVAGIAVGAAIGGTVVLLLVALVVVCLLVAPYYIVTMRERNRDAEWEIKITDLEMGPLLGKGGHGEVNRAVWRGTEVAVKTLPVGTITREAAHAFKDEVRVMTALRHPNVVLFMAACTKPPRLAIVMEYMALGSLHDLLDNELVTQIPFGLKVKIAYQTAKGMHFLHSSGVVHRDLKSLNVLLDAKWNAKISDFGLTHFVADRNTTHQGVVGTVHWTAPEVLSGDADADAVLADVYSFGIVMWEVLARRQPYLGMSPAAIAVGVIRDGLRPPLSREDDPATHLTGESMLHAEAVSDYIDLTIACWDADPQMRPSFLEVMTRLTRITDQARDASDLSQHHYSSNSSSSGQSMRTVTGTGTGTSSSSGDERAGLWGGASRPPDGRVALVFSDIAGAHVLWSKAPAEMRDATLLHNDLLRAVAAEHGGHEATLPRGSGEGTFCMAFADPLAAARWCADVQRRLLQLAWPEALLDHTDAAQEWGHDARDQLLFTGLRVRMGMHVGHERAAVDHKTRRAEYRGNTAREALRLVAHAQPGQVLLSAAAARALDDLDPATAHITCVAADDTDADLHTYELRPRELDGRFFAARGPAASDGGSSNNNSTGTFSCERFAPDGRHQADATKQYVASANMVRWIIDFADIDMADQEPVGAGSYGVVYRGRWSGVDVAVKRLVKQRLTERRLLEFRAEVAFLSELQHPNVVLFVGACVHTPNLCVITEYMAKGSLASVLANTSGERLPFGLRMRMLRAAATGVAYLHGLAPPIVHRDLKSSNLLVDEAYNVKVADFGLARIREENATMTQCGTPCWTAPEIIRGERYDESADVYSFAIIMWETLTRRKPYENAGFMNVSLDVLAGTRPPLPNDCPEPLADLIRACWHDNPKKRPAMIDVVRELDALVGDDGGVPV